MATARACIMSVKLWPIFRQGMTSVPWCLKPRQACRRSLTVSAELNLTAEGETRMSRRISKNEEKVNNVRKRRDGDAEDNLQEESEKLNESEMMRKSLKDYGDAEDNLQEESEKLNESEMMRKSLKDYFDQVEVMIRSDGGPPRWFSPLECGSYAPDSPLLLYLPGIDGVGLGLTKQHQRLGEIFNIWCLHIPVEDRTSFKELRKMVEATVRSEKYGKPNRPIYIVGESIGACLALAVAAHNPDIEILLLLANPATFFDNSILQLVQPLLEIMPNQFLLDFPAMSKFIKDFLPYFPQISLEGDLSKILGEGLLKGPRLPPTIGNLPEDLVSLLAYLSIVADILPKDTLLWKLDMLRSASAYANSRLKFVKAETLILSSGLFLSRVENERLHRTLSKCQIRRFSDCSPFLFMEEGFDLVTVIKCTCFYRRKNYQDYVSDFIPPTYSEFKRMYQSYRWLHIATSPAVFSTLEDGTIVRGLDGIPSEGPVLYVGNHMLLGIDLIPLFSQFMMESNIVFCAMGHPIIFTGLRGGMFQDILPFDHLRLMGAVPVYPSNLYKALSSKSHVLLYPGGIREASHRKGEEHKLIWPEKSEFVRMAANFGAKIVPFGSVGEDDLAQVVIDYDDMVKFPFIKTQIETMTRESVMLRNDATGAVANQPIHVPGILPKIPGRFYYYFGKPIETEGRKQVLRDRDRCQQLYKEVISEVENCVDYLKRKRQNDPYRNIFPRLIYQANHGTTSQVPTFDL